MTAPYLQAILSSTTTVDCLEHTRLSIVQSLRRHLSALPEPEVGTEVSATRSAHAGPLVSVTESSEGFVVALVAASHGLAYAAFRVTVSLPMSMATHSLVHDLELCAAATGLVLRALQLEADVRCAKATGDALIDASRLARVAPSLSVDELLSRMASIVHRCINTEYVSIYLVNEASRSLFCMFSDTLTVSGGALRYHV